MNDGYESKNYSQGQNNPNGSGGGNKWGGGGGYNKPWKGNAGGGGGGFQNKFRKKEEPIDFEKFPPKFYKPYVLTGNTDAPQEALTLIQTLATKLAELDYTVRTSGFDGPDKSLHSMALKELILPWSGFGGVESKFTFTSEEAKFLARKTFSGYDALTNDSVKTFLAKNVRLVFGQNLRSPALFVVVWTKDGVTNPKDASRDTGNMRHVITVAHENRIPLFNLGREGEIERIYRFLRITNETT